MSDPTPATACPACGREVNAEPATKRQRKCQVCKTTITRKVKLPRPMAPVATSIADALELLGVNPWGATIGGLVRSSLGTPIGEVVIHVRIFDGAVVGGKVGNVTPEIFLKALRVDWNMPMLPRETPTEENGATVADAVSEMPAPTESAGELSREDQRRSFRTPFPWEVSE